MDSSNLLQRLENVSLNIPAHEELERDMVTSPYFTVAVRAFLPQEFDAEPLKFYATEPLNFYATFLMRSNVYSVCCSN